MTGAHDSIWEALDKQGFDGELDLSSRRSLGGGDISEAYYVQDRSGQAYCVKLHANADLLEAEWHNLNLLAPAAITTPRPHYFVGSGHGGALAMEYLPLTGQGDDYALGQALAALHRDHCSDQGYGLDEDNYIGHSRQRNGRHRDWADFWWHCRLQPQLKLAAAQRFHDLPDQAQSEHWCRRLLAAHSPSASLLHGDLWSGNKAYLPDGSPVIFDPACYYGDREADLAFTRVFGGFSQAFYQGYEDSWPLPPGWAQRQPLYNLYHLLNHLNMFGGGYLPAVLSAFAEIERAVSRHRR